MTEIGKTIAVVGGGLVGLVGALAIADALKASGGKVVLIAAKPAVSDRRTTAMLLPSVNLLRRLGAWSDLADRSSQEVSQEHSRSASRRSNLTHSTSSRGL